MKKHLCLNTVFLSLFVPAAIAYKFSCYECADYADVSAEVENHPQATKKLLEDINDRSRPACQLRNSTAGISLIRCGLPGELELGCASGDILTSFNFTYLFLNEKVPARVSMRLRFRACYARDEDEEPGCRDVQSHPELLKAQIMRFARNKNFKVKQQTGDVCICDGQGCNTNLPQMEPQKGAGIPILHSLHLVTTTCLILVAQKLL